MLNITHKVEINSNDYSLAVKTMLEEICAYYKQNTSLGWNEFVGQVFSQTFLTEFAGLEYHFANYKNLQQKNPSLLHLLGFSLSLPVDFDVSCNPLIEIVMAIKSEWCADVVVKQNKLFDYLRYTLSSPCFWWEGLIATDIKLDNSQNINPKKYRLSSFKEIRQEAWAQTQVVENYVISQQVYTARLLSG